MGIGEVWGHLQILMVSSIDQERGKLKLIKTTRQVIVLSSTIFGRDTLANEWWTCNFLYLSTSKQYWHVWRLKKPLREKCLSDYGPYITNINQTKGLFAFPQSSTPTTAMVSKYDKDQWIHRCRIRLSRFPRLHTVFQKLSNLTKTSKTGTYLWYIEAPLLQDINARWPYYCRSLSLKHPRWISSEA